MGRRIAIKWQIGSSLDKIYIEELDEYEPYIDYFKREALRLLDELNYIKKVLYKD